MAKDVAKDTSDADAKVKAAQEAADAKAKEAHDATLKVRDAEAEAKATKEEAAKVRDFRRAQERVSKAISEAKGGDVTVASGDVRALLEGVQEPSELLTSVADRNKIKSVTGRPIVLTPEEAEAVLHAAKEPKAEPKAETKHA